MRSIGNLGRNLAVVALSVWLSASCAQANILSAVEINAQDSGYGIVLKTEQATQVKKTITATDKISIELKDVEVASDFNTVYNDVADVDNVTVAPASKNGVKITLKGKNVSDSKVFFDTMTSSAITSPSQTIELSAPVNTYTPVYTPEMFNVQEEVTESQTANPQLNEVLTKMHITKGMLITVKKYAGKVVNKTKNLDINVMTIIGMIFVLAAFMLRPTKRQSGRANEPQSLSKLLTQNQRTPQMDREIALNKTMANSMQLRKNNTLATSPVSAGYGMKAYQQSQRNPYTTTVQSASNLSGLTQRRALQPVAPIKKTVTTNKPVSLKANSPIQSKAPYMINPTMKKAPTAVVSQEAEMDSMKFLESITKIYEKSGRTDLAKGLKDNLKKAQLSQEIAV